MKQHCRIGYYLSHATPYGRAELRFRAATPDGRTVLESAVFKGDAAVGPNRLNPEHRAALDELLARLTEQGWRVVGGDDPWYERRLERPSA